MLPIKLLLARNVRAVLDREGLKQPDLIPLGIPGGTGHRILTGHNVRIETLEAVARAINTPAWQLLHPEFDAEQPLIVQSAVEREAEVARRVRETLSPVAAIIGALRDEQRTGHVGRNAGQSYPDRADAEGRPRSTTKSK